MFSTLKSVPGCVEDRSTGGDETLERADCVRFGVPALACTAATQPAVVAIATPMPATMRQACARLDEAIPIVVPYPFRSTLHPRDSRRRSDVSVPIGTSPLLGECTQTCVSLRPRR